MSEATLEQVEALLNKTVEMPLPSDTAPACVDAVSRESADRGDQLFQRIKLAGLPTWDALKSGTVEQQVDVALYCVLHHEVPPNVPSNQPAYWDYTRRQDIKRAMGIQLLRAVLTFTDMQIAALIFNAARKNDPDEGVPTATILGTVEKHCHGKAPEEPVVLALQFLWMRIQHHEDQLWPSKRTQQIKDRVDAILTPDHEGDTQALPSGSWLTSLDAWLAQRTEKQRANWMALLVFAASAGDKSKPAKKWLKEAEPLIAAIGRPTVAGQLKTWLSATVPDPHETDLSLDVLKGMIFAATVLDHEDLAPEIGRFAEVCFKKVPQIGARSVKLGNACIAALSGMTGSDTAVAELVRLKARIKYSSVRDLVARRLGELADKAGVSVADLEESGLPDFGFGPDGIQLIELGDATANITLGESGVKLTWTGVDGKPRKAPPASVKRDFADELKAVKQKIKDIDIAHGVQTSRLEASWVEGRAWPVETWRSRYLDHHLRRHISDLLIWRIEKSEGSIDVMAGEGGLVDLKGQHVELPTDATIRLWHPLDAGPEDVLAWRRRIMDAGITQPIKQAHREIYVLTDAERSTEIYSNRFAAHILRQHQFRALCQARGWRYELQGYWDSFNLPQRDVSERDMRVGFHVEFVDNQETSDHYIPLHIATDQVRFYKCNVQIRLEEVPAIVFSELMRDVDLFVAVTSVANDPDWTDGGPEGRFGGYWQDHAFGDLSQTAQTRRALLAEIVPKLAIADRLRVDGNFLEVQGERHCYRIHIGSSNIQIMPDNRYLCIVRGASGKAGANVKLPFTGDSHMSVILSKAFMLASDHKITDKTILSQLELDSR